jgi:fructan beta-fructosidase
MKIIFSLFFVLTILLNVSKNVNRSGVVDLHNDTTHSYRPLFHFSPDSNWINDPNGLVYFKGKYHLFFQYNPFGNKWGHMSWGHAISTDLMHWTQLPVAIPEFIKDSLATMIFSGSAVIDSFNTTGFATKKGQMPIVAIYTSSVTNKDVQVAQNQSIAYSLDEGNTWKQYDKNPVLDIGSKEFRDPKVFWYQPKKKWIMVVSKATEHKVQFYESHNLTTWKYLSEFGNIGNVDKVWECPDIFQLHVKGSNETKWVLSLSAGHPQKDYLAMQYFIGDFNGKKFVANSMDYPLYMDYGKDYYAGITYNNMSSSDGRKIMIGWANCWNYANDIPTGNIWRGVYSLPRQLTLKKAGNSYSLIQLPVKELEVLGKEVFSLNNKEVDSIFDVLFTGDSYDLEMNIEPKNANETGIKILKSAKEEIVLKYNNTLKEFTLDRTKSGNIEFNKTFPSIEKTNVLLHNGIIKLKVIVDKCIVEVFINDGEETITDLVFPRENKGGIQLFSNGGKTVFKSLKIFKVK